MDVSISIVLYLTNQSELEYIINLINRSELVKRIYLVDNSPTDELKKLGNLPSVEYIFNNANLGYGAGHNIALKKVKYISKYHLILNADVDFDPSILKMAFDFMEFNPQVVMLSPQILWPSGELQHFSRKLPTPFDLIARRFLPNFLKPIFQSKMDEYILLHRDYKRSMNIPNLPGCFMFVRTDIINEINGFDENYFMYVEDIDLTRRLHQIGETLYYPEIVIKHSLAQGSGVFSKLMLYHIKSAIHYFNKWGWFFDKKRTLINKRL